MFRVLRLLENGTVAIAPFHVVVPCSETLDVAPAGFSFLVSPVLDVPGTDVVYCLDGAANVYAFSLATGQALKQLTPGVAADMKDRLARYSCAMVGSHRYLAVVSSDSNAIALHTISDRNDAATRGSYNAAFVHQRREPALAETSRLARVPANLLARPPSYVVPSTGPSGLAHVEQFCSSFIQDLGAAAVMAHESRAILPGLNGP